jgi:hypothetical protein
MFPNVLKQASEGKHFVIIEGSSSSIHRPEPSWGYNELRGHETPEIDGQGRQAGYTPKLLSLHTHTVEPIPVVVPCSSHGTHPSVPFGKKPIGQRPHCTEPISLENPSGQFLQELCPVVSWYCPCKQPKQPEKPEREYLPAGHDLQKV